jgi:CubicO group peptidase (beta-lactamase class C family)
MTTTAATRAGMDLKRLDRIDAWVQRYIDEGRIAGMQVLVTRHGEVVYDRPFGQRDIERRLPTEEDTLYRIYSMSKPITSVALMMLFEEGGFQLDRPVHRFIPEWANQRVLAGGTYPDLETRAPKRAPTVRDLLSHQAGLSYGGMLDMGSPVDRVYRDLKVAPERHNSTLGEVIPRIGQAPLEYEPGEAWKYSIATDVCGYLVEAISGMPLDRFLRERIFEPLGMVDTGFDVTTEQQPRFAANYRRGADRRLQLVDDPQDSPYLRPATFFSGGGGLVSTMDDYRRFCQMLLNGGELDGTRILGPRTLELMTINHLPDGADLTERARGGFSETTSGGIGFGLGFAVHIDQSRSAQSASEGIYYWGGAASTGFWVDPLEDLACVFMTQLMPSSTYDFPRQLRSLVYSAIVD